MKIYSCVLESLDLVIMQNEYDTSASRRLRMSKYFRLNKIGITNCKYKIFWYFKLARTIALRQKFTSWGEQEV